MSTTLSHSPAFASLYEAHLRYVTRIARRFADGEPDEAADLAQEGWLAVLALPEARWTEPRYVRTVIFRAMLRWRATEATQRVITPVRHAPQQRPKRRHLRATALHVRRNTPRVQVGARHSLPTARQGRVGHDDATAPFARATVTAATSSARPVAKKNRFLGGADALVDVTARTKTSDTLSETRRQQFTIFRPETSMQLRQFNELDAARRAYAFLTATPLAPPLAAMPASLAAQVQTLGTTIGQLDAQAAAQTSAAGSVKDKASAAVVAAKELRSGHLVPVRKVAKLLAKGPSGASLSPNFAQSITVPHSQNYQALLAAAAAAVQNVTLYKDLFVARGLPADFLDQMTAQATVLSQAIGATSAAKGARVTATTDIAQLMHELRSTMHVLEIGVTKLCKGDRVNGPTTMSTWKNAKAIRKAAVPTDVPFAPLPTVAHPATPSTASAPTAASTSGTGSTGSSAGVTSSTTTA